MTALSPALDLFPLLAATLAATTCGLLGNFLVLRRLSLMGDAISHSVLPGLVIAFLLTATRSPLAMFLGAAAAGLATVVLVELVKQLGRVEPGAAMGVVFSVLFALGVLLIEQAAARHVDLDAHCVLHGQLETLAWYDAPSSWAGVLSASTLWAAPRQVITLAIVALLSACCVIALFKEFRIAAFDPALATTQGFSAGLLHYTLMLLVATATVASFEAVGSILVIAMLVCPGATARLLTDRLLPQIVWSVVIAITSAVGGYIAATALPAWLGAESVNAAGSIAVTAGVLLTLAIAFSPSHGILPRLIRRRTLATTVARDDLLATLYRATESGDNSTPIARLQHAFDRRPLRRAISSATNDHLISTDADHLTLTKPGTIAAERILRKHRLWEHYLVGEAGLAPDHVHFTAEQLEHLDPSPPTGPKTDPHGHPIPPGE